MVETYRVTVYDAKIVSLVQVGDVARWTRETAKEVERVARVLAPKRTMRLANSHVTLPTLGSNQYQKRYRISAMAPHAHFVHGGTGIYGPTHAPIDVGKPMGPIPGPGPRYIRRSMGQRAQPWLERAAEAVGRRI